MRSDFGGFNPITNSQLQQEQPVTFMFWLNELAAVDATMTGVEMDPRGWFITLPHWSAARR